MHLFFVVFFFLFCQASSFSALKAFRNPKTQQREADLQTQKRLSKRTLSEALAWKGEKQKKNWDAGCERRLLREPHRCKLYAPVS